MHFSQLGVAAALTSLSRAILVPPTITPAESELVNSYADFAITAGSILQIDCPGCPVVVTDLEGNQHTTAVENALRLNLTVAQRERDVLLLNGIQIYPMDPTAESSLELLTAAQLVHTADQTWQYAAEPKLGFSLAAKHPVHSEKDQLDLVDVHVQILEVGNTFVDTIPGVEIKLVETMSGKLMLGDVTTTPQGSVAPTDGSQECTTLLCKWRVIVAGKLSKLKGCGSKHKPNATGSKHSSGRPHRPHHKGGRPHASSGPHRAFRHHRHRHGFGRLLKSITMHVLVPIIVGVAVGITASLIGMLVGNLVVFIYRALFRRNRAQYTQVEQEDSSTTESTDDESKEFMEPQGPPPTYTAVAEKI